jgi:transposase
MRAQAEVPSARRTDTPTYVAEGNGGRRVLSILGLGHRAPGFRSGALVRRQPGLDATNWRAELAIRFGVLLRKVWCGSRTWAGARAQSVLLSVWRTCWQQGRPAVVFLSQLLRGTLVPLALPP